jgi:hypothetical protein
MEDPPMTAITELFDRDCALSAVAPSSLCIAAFDPGLSGAIAFYYPEHDRISVEDMPVVAGDVDGATLAARIRQFEPDLAIVEIASSRPGQGVSSVFKFGCGYGVVLGVLAALDVPTHLVAPSKWKKHFGLSADKEKSRALVLRFWPSRCDLSGRKKHHGRAESALLARYGAEKIPGDSSHEAASREGTPPGRSPVQSMKQPETGAKHE